MNLEGQGRGIMVRIADDLQHIILEFIQPSGIVITHLIQACHRQHMIGPVLFDHDPLPRGFTYVQPVAAVRVQLVKCCITDHGL